MVGIFREFGIVRVDRDNNNEIKSTTLYRPTSASLSQDDKENLKLLNVCDPYVHEFFFGGRIVVVEGDTEYTAFSWLKNIFPNTYDDVHIVRARGKGVIPSIVKILNQFTCNYAVLHDTDSPKTINGNINPAWTMNQNILREIGKNSNSDKIRLIACRTNFEIAIFGPEVAKDKPYNAITKLKNNEDLKGIVKQLLDSLLDINNAPPSNCIRWNKIEQLQIEASVNEQ